MEKRKFVIDLSDNYDKESFKSSLTDLRSVITSLMQDGSGTDKRGIENALSFIQQLEDAANNAPSVDPRSDTNATQQVFDWLFERKQTFNVWIEGLADVLQYLTLTDNQGHDKECAQSCFTVAGVRELLQGLVEEIDKKDQA